MRASSALLRLPLLVGSLALLAGCGIFSREEPLNPPADLTRFDQTIQVQRAWSTNVGRGAEQLRLGLVPAADETTVFAAAHDGRISAFDLERGRRLWSERTRLPLSGGPSLHDGLLVLGSSNGDVIALDAATGEIRWQSKLTGEVLAPPVQTDRLVIVRTVDGKLTALDRGDGRQRWFVQQSVPRLSVRGTGAPVVSGNFVIGGFDNGRVAAYALSDGTPAWDTLLTPPTGRNEVERLVDISATPRVAADDVFVAGFQGRVAALAIESGQPLWSRDIASYAGIGLDRDNLYVASARSEVIALSRRGARELWRQDVLLNRAITGPVRFGDSVVVGDFQGYLHWLDPATGELQARVRAGSDRITQMPVVAGGLLLVLTEGGRLFAYRVRE